MQLPALNAPHSLTFLFTARRSDPLRHLLSAFFSIVMKDTDYACISHYRESIEQAFVIEAHKPIPEYTKSRILTLMQNSPFLTFISVSET